MPEETAEEILDQPSEQRRAVQSHREYVSVSPYTSEKMAMVRALTEEMS